MSRTEETNMQANLAAMATGVHILVLQQENKTIDEAFGKVDRTVSRTTTPLDIV